MAAKTVLFFFFAIIAYYFFTSEYTTKLPLPVSIRIFGAQKTLDRFKKEAGFAQYNKQHLLMHAFGAALYSVLGSQGLSSCDDSFGYGCFHGFILAASKKESYKAMAHLRDGCLKNEYWQSTECLHGLGHGIISSLGHNNIQKALKVCSENLPVKLTKACSTGVFMEFNFRTMDETDKGISVRPFNPAKANFPCNEVAEMFASHCYQFQANWWYTTLAKNLEKIDLLCARVKETKSSDSCYRGVGYSVAAAKNFDFTDIKTDCGKLIQLRNQAICRAGAASGILKVLPLSQQAETLCDGLAASLHKICTDNIERPQNQ